MDEHHVDLGFRARRLAGVKVAQLLGFDAERRSKHSHSQTGTLRREGAICGTRIHEEASWKAELQKMKDALASHTVWPGALAGSESLAPTKPTMCPPQDHAGTAPRFRRPGPDIPTRARRRTSQRGLAPLTSSTSLPSLKSQRVDGSIVSGMRDSLPVGSGEWERYFHSVGGARGEAERYGPMDARAVAMATPRVSSASCQHASGDAMLHGTIVPSTAWQAARPAYGARSQLPNVQRPAIMFAAQQPGLPPVPPHTQRKAHVLYSQ